MGENEIVEHVMLECVKYARDRNEMMKVVLWEMEHGRVKTARECMVVVLGMCGEIDLEG